jgi:predicted glycosyltransferase involved in capsule biosynthesis
MFTYIIPFKYTYDRLLTLSKVLDNIRKIDCEIIIVEQGLESVLPSKNILTQGEKYIFILNNFPFNKSWGLNCAWKESSNDIIVFGDADNLIDTKNITKSIDEMSDYDFISPHIRLIDLSESENSLPSEDIFKIQRAGRGELDHQKLPMCGAMTIFKKEALEKIGGWPEEFFGWGAEDDAMSIKVKHFLNWKENNNNCYHLFHQRVVPDMQWYQRNLQVYTNYAKASKEKLEEYINSTKHLIGDKNRIFS